MKTKPKILVLLTTTFPRWRDDTDPTLVFELWRNLAYGNGGNKNWRAVYAAWEDLR